ncbi:MAG: hypothetical protein VB118_02290 [Oscillospiraceae bacterium]|nr:hypothetical protein [Oscillospiraceae bacterium]
MKKLCFVLCLIIIQGVVLAGCSEKTSVIPLGVYSYQESDEPVKPNVTLREDNRFQFEFSIVSSYCAIGTYIVDGKNLILNTDDGNNKYVFEIKDKTLIINKKESSELPSYVKIPDRSVFK